MTLPHQQQQAQIIQFLRNQVAQGVLTREQAQERLVVLRTATAHAPNPPSPQIIHYLHNQGAQDLLTHERQAQERLVLLRTSTGDAPYPPSPQIIQFLRNQVAQGLLTREQAQERLTVLSRSHAPHPPSQQNVQCSRLPPLPEDRFKVLFAQFANITGLSLNAPDFVIDGRLVNPWVLHRAVFARNGFDSVTANDEWPAVGATLGFPPISAGDLTQPPRCAPPIAHRLQQLYNDSLRRFEQAYINNILTRLRSSQALRQMSAEPPQQQAQPHQPTDTDFLLDFTRMHLGADEENMSGHRSGRDEGSEGTLPRTSEEDRGVWR
ncbi:hypothetical protein EI94DRAFT_1695896 [Lactarius quietus]|nr:hypothetical protein EI94DRAFT_1695896 [Lactarius quietus]